MTYLKIIGSGGYSTWRKSRRIWDQLINEKRKVEKLVVQINGASASGM